MANERLWIYCNHCDAKNLLYKYYPLADLLDDAPKSYLWDANEIEEFLTMHIQLHDGGVTFDGMPFRLEK